jgi:hypothetical protein
MRKPVVPMSPDELPQQRIYPVVDLPERPQPFDVLFDGLWPPGTVAKRPYAASFLCHAEWAWSPMHNRICGYYLGRGRTHWVLWSFDPQAHEPSGYPRWQPVACVPRGQATEREAEVHLLLAHWASEREFMGVDRVHWINETGALSVGEVHAVATRVWGD